MHGEIRIKFVDAKQAKCIHNYRNIKKKLQRSNASIWFNKVRRSEHLEPKYIEIKINGNSERSHITRKAAIKYRINAELKHLYKKKAHLNKQLYTARLACANYWKKSWYWIVRSEHQYFQNMNDTLYNKLNKKNSMIYDRQNHRNQNRAIAIQQLGSLSTHVLKTCLIYTSIRVELCI
jgi:hypothetical protein